MTDRLLSELTEEDLIRVVKDAVRSELTMVGLNVEEPLKQQAELRHLSAWYDTTRTMEKHGLIAFVTLFVGGVVTTIVLGVRSWFHN